jgi:hypothetical protein
MKSALVKNVKSRATLMKMFCAWSFSIVSRLLLHHLQHSVTYA